MAKSGFMESFRPYAGFYDAFKTDFPVHQDGIQATATTTRGNNTTIPIDSEDINKFAEGEYVYVTHDSGTATILTTINQIAPGSNNLKLNTAVSGITKDSTRIRRSYGTVYNSTFSFGHEVGEHPGNKSVRTGFDDDTFGVYSSNFSIDAPETGWATTFPISPRIASDENGYYLSSIKVGLKRYGTPGPLKCYVIKESNVSQWHHPANSSSIILAESNPLTLANKQGKEQIVEFDFFVNGGYPFLGVIGEKDENQNDVASRFCMIIEAGTGTSRTSGNYYELLFLRHKTGDADDGDDLQKNNTVYKYNKSISGSGLTRDADYGDRADLFYGVTLLPKIPRSFEPHTTGLYSARIDCPDPVQVNSARVMLRVAREGIFTVESASTSLGTNYVPANGNINITEHKEFRFDGESQVLYTPFQTSGYTTYPVVVGNFVKYIASSGENKLSLSTGCYVRNGDPIYPVTHQVFLTCRNVNWDGSQKLATDNEYLRVELKPKYVQPNYMPGERAAIEKLAYTTNFEGDDAPSEVLVERMRDKLRPSDRIIFEMDLHDPITWVSNGVTQTLDASEIAVALGKKWNRFDLQIYWKSSNNLLYNSCCGRIYDVVVSFTDKSYSSSDTVEAGS